ncbi:hypothetical protein KAFR_0A01370 [Kazachstania africana CBS 2517]|uniref:Ribosome-releasing factor 2, mitochondrial n=1 Tax=Kazachstania africana (strain ATCC 22294 / BCRC 22015 / CBS 2517 / CECT 1963 / NBRC 1671 / NRRL Y-8276) TaxID=1071382 RepID=H2AMH5_KAZAF|nr:hypothetical protein KAFR_0A01370 [Kazachstania africana CBS 2517]CCF55575.1 hypothetical protein KAFR_0A01370 [Kazachstania africana CBS 2517]
MLKLRIFLRPYSNLSKFRNTGIIAHIDAGKTTTTERMLYYAGKTKRMGNVDHGDTVTDFLPQERARGITIQSATTTFNWGKGGCVNLIDTPGHADFSFEVMRSLKVIDGCVTILDAVAAVESQTEKVWKLSKGIPKICFINKMDRVGAGFSRTVKEIITKLQTRVAICNIPLFSNTTQDAGFQGVIDIINDKIIKWESENPDKYAVHDIVQSVDPTLYEEVLNCRTSLIETLGEIDEIFVEHFLEEAEADYMKVSPIEIMQAIRRNTIKNTIVPVLCGASLKNIGIQPLLDAIVSYLPNPTEARLPELNNSAVPITYDEKNGLVFDHNNNICVALAFKVITDTIRGLMVFIRVYSGQLRNGCTVYNTTTQTKFKLGKLAIMNANVPEETDVVSAGQIGVLTGSTIAEKVATGDTIISHNTKKDGVKSFNKNVLSLKINPIRIPPPVFSATVEPKTLGNKDSMDAALSRIVLEDPSLHVSKDMETGETVLSGLGELHLAIAEDKLVNQLGAEVRFGKTTVTFKETLTYPSDVQTISNELGFQFSISIVPLELYRTNKHGLDSSQTDIYLGMDNNYLSILKNNIPINAEKWLFPLPYESFVHSLMASAIACFQRGGRLLNFPLHSCVAIVHDWEIPVDVTKPNEVLNLSRNLMNQILTAIPSSSYTVLEPLMNIKIIAPTKYLGSLIQDLTGARNATILSVQENQDLSAIEGNIKYRNFADEQYLPPDPTMASLNASDQIVDVKIINARAPLRNLMAYNKTLRSITQGTAELSIDYHDMEKVPEEQVQMILSGA